jgi:agmatinase
MFFATSTYEDSRYVVFGAPYDRTCTFKKGTRYGPAGIRDASHDFELYEHDHRVNLDEAKVHDAGDLPLSDLTSEEMVASVNAFSKKLVADGKFPILLGGEHSVSPGCATAFDNITVLGIDAHADFRDEYQGNKNNHACAMRRIVDKFGEENVMWIAVRSMARAEHESSAKIIDSFSILRNGIDWAISEIHRKLPEKKIYVSLDIDGLDPAYAPGTGTPEPYGLNPFHVKRIIDALAPRMVGFDVVEVSPPLDNGVTSILAARLVANVIAATHASAASWNP